MKKFFASLKDRLFGNYERVVDFTSYIKRRDIKSSRISAAAGYVMFFIPLVFNGDNQYARFHANQSLINLILSTVGAVLLGMIPYAGPFLMMLQELLCVIWLVRGIIFSLKGKAVGIPFVGWITIFAYRYPGQ